LHTVLIDTELQEVAILGKAIFNGGFDKDVPLSRNRTISSCDYTFATPALNPENGFAIVPDHVEKELYLVIKVYGLPVHLALVGELASQ